MALNIANGAHGYDYCSRYAESGNLGRNRRLERVASACYSLSVADFTVNQIIHLGVLSAW